MTLEQALATPRSGNLDHLRMLAATAVIVSHAWPLALGLGAVEPLTVLTGHSLGAWAVALFFFLSGLLVSRSAARRRTGSFLAARVRRILPGLTAALCVTLALAWATGSTAGPAEAARYLLRGLTLVSIEHRLTDAFAANPYPLAVNGPLWSLPHEVLAYALCLMAHRAGLMRSTGGVALVLALALAAWVAAPVLPARLQGFAPLWLAFVLGMVVQHLARGLPLAPAAALLLALGAPLGWPLAVLALGYGALVVVLRLPALPRAPDLSFGLYLYGWPLAQVVLHLLPGLSPGALAVTSLLATLPFAAASWHLVERPALLARPPAQGVPA